MPETIPVFVSCPSELNPGQEEARKIILYHLEQNHLEARALGRSGYPVNLPLTEVCRIARRCFGGVILGFEQFHSNSGVEKPGTKSEKRVREGRSFPTPWNDMEAAILYALKKPLLIFHEPQVNSGIFEYGVVDRFTQPMPVSINDPSLGDIFEKWVAEVRQIYNAD